MRIEFTQLCVLRLLKDETGAVHKLKKYIFLSDVVSYEEDNVEFDNYPEDVICILTHDESFCCVGSIDDFDKIIKDYIKSITKN